MTGTSERIYSRTAPSFTFSSTSPDLRYFRCGIDGASSWGECGPTFTWPADAAEGVHTVHVHSYDWADNLSSNMEVRRWVKDSDQAGREPRAAPYGATKQPPPVVHLYGAQDADPQSYDRVRLGQVRR